MPAAPAPSVARFVIARKGFDVGDAKSAVVISRSRLLHASTAVSMKGFFRVRPFGFILSEVEG
jgi:hypothetical protein